MRPVLVETAIRIIAFSLGIAAIPLSALFVNFGDIQGLSSDIYSPAGFANITLFLSLLSFFFALPLTFFLSQKILTSSFKARMLPAGHSLVEVTKELCKKLGISPVPEVLVADVDETFCCIYGMSPRKAKLVLSKRIMNILSEQELKAVLTHELGHIANQDILLMTWGSALIKFMRVWVVIVIPVFLLSAFLSVDNFSSADFARGSLEFIALVFPFVAVFPMITILSTSRMREFLADAIACHHLDNRSDMISALVKISLDILSSSVRARGLSYLNIADSEKDGFFKTLKNGLLKTHPSVRERVAAIQSGHYSKDTYEPRLETAVFVGISALYISIGATNLAGNILQIDYSFYIGILSGLLSVSCLCVISNWYTKSRKAAVRFCTIASFSLMFPIFALSLYAILSTDIYFELLVLPLIMVPAILAATIAASIVIPNACEQVMHRKG